MECFNGRHWTAAKHPLTHRKSGDGDRTSDDDGEEMVKPESQLHIVGMRERPTQH